MSEPTNNDILLEERDGRVSPVAPRPLTDDQLIKVVTDFREGVLEGRVSRGMCYIICWPLQSYLSALASVETELIAGLVDGWEHWWLELPDGRIIDPTADQFAERNGRPLPPVYLGPLPNWYEEER